MQPSLLARLYYATKLSALQLAYRQGTWLQSCKSYLSPRDTHPDLVKTYECRPHLPVRIFFAPGYDGRQPSDPLPVLFTIHGGGFAVGEPADDDAWNHTFANRNGVLVVGLNYSKAPTHPFPTGLHDVHALFRAVLADADLPIDKTRTAVAGFSAGGNLALGLSQLDAAARRKEGEQDPSSSSWPGLLRAAIPIYAPLDLSIPTAGKAARRRWKQDVAQLRGGIRGAGVDPLLLIADAFNWGYVPYGTDLRDPLVSPFFAARETLPQHVCVVAAELDFLAWESWAFASRLAGRQVGPGTVGRGECGAPSELELGDERFAWTVEERSAGEEEDGTSKKSTGVGSVRWLLVPDVVHSFDLHDMSTAVSDGETVRDGNAKAVKMIDELGTWLGRTVWGHADR
ncbi:alpha/beta hydrolase fold protein [Sodiomyces alkalinus F11]|uniref:Alpha/beta hydrolase fold protein n=1 Tax=Sodiomyces alkalinus (strain CBS 110278 / VKM F-3762 / F11) TaxID=1314773 RepID=A0A3N2PUZ0_SODAK|nr:alpha/beta hydrolase fold protein [Sodiomyces alkalinus F11]ROT38294.1 alpha/beta hydrolase fold protein [Sodiomyces alkalinus F11]